MTRRIALWPLTGFVVASFWILYGIVSAPNPTLSHWTVIAITAPASLLGRTMPLTWYTFALLNAFAYLLIGLATELLRTSLKHRTSH
jgi:hypothetical protein